VNWLVFSEAPCGTERSFNGIRCAEGKLEADPANQVRMFDFSDAVISVAAGQTTPNAYCNLANKTSAPLSKGAKIGDCIACTDARGLGAGRLVHGDIANQQLSWSSGLPWPTSLSTSDSRRGSDFYE
jgi:uncharacterized protein involved in oxidation of intracellular sulfur